VTYLTERQAMPDRRTPSASITIERLREIPDLAMQVYASRDTPHRPGRPTTASVTTQGPRVSSGCPQYINPRKRTATPAIHAPIPASVIAWDMLRTDEHGRELEYLIEACVAVRDDMAEAPDMPSPRWADVCADLIALREWWESDDVLLDFVGDAAGRAHRALRRWVGESLPPRLTCPRCSGRLHRDRYAATDDVAEQLACADCGQIIGPKEVAHRARMRTPAALPEIAGMVGVTERTLRRWAEAGVLHPVTDHEPSPRRPALYLPADALALTAAIRDA